MVPRDPARLRTSSYLALVPPPRVRNALAELMTQVGTRDPAPHVTLVAPPEVPPGGAWLDAVRGVAAATAPFPIRLGETSSFDDRVRFLVVEGDGVYRLRDALEGALELAPRVAPFVAHLTIAVAHHGHPLATLDRESIPSFVHQPFVVEALELLTRAGPAVAYVRDRSFPFAGAP